MLLLLDSVHRIILHDARRFGNRFCFRLQVRKASNPVDPLHRDILSQSTC